MRFSSKKQNNDLQKRKPFCQKILLLTDANMMYKDYTLYSVQGFF